MRGEDAKQTPAKRDDAVAKRSGSSPDTNDSDEGSGGGRLTRALVVSAVSAALVFLVFGVFLFGITSWLLPELLVWAVAAFAGGMGVAGYYTWRHRE